MEDMGAIHQKKVKCRNLYLLIITGRDVILSVWYQLTL